MARAATATTTRPPPPKQAAVRPPPPSTKRSPPPPPHFDEPPQEYQASDYLIIQPWGLCGGLGQCGANASCAGTECANGYSCEFYDEMAWQCQPAIIPFWAAAATATAGEEGYSISADMQSWL